MHKNEKICSFCLKSNIIKTNIDHDLQKAVNVLFEIDISIDDTKICQECTKTITEFYTYYCDVKENLKLSTKVPEEIVSVIIKKESCSSDSSDTEIDDPPLFQNESDVESNDEVKREKSPLPSECEPKIEISESKNISEESVNESNTPKMYECDVCKLTFRTFTYVKRHIRQKHLKMYDVGCKICGKRLYDTTSLKRHIESVHKNIKRPPRRTECPHCGVIIANLASHLKYKHPIFRNLNRSTVKKEENPEIYICDICSNTFVRKLYLRKHLFQKHLNIYEDKCPECNKEFYDKTAVKRHIKEHHMKDRPPPKRSVCVKCGKYVTAIQLHMRRVHNSDNPETKPKKILPKVECTICKKMISSRQDNINEHNRRMHGANIPKKVKKKKIDK